MKRAWMAAVTVAVTTAAGIVLMAEDDGQRLLSVDHFVRVTSTVPAIAGQTAQLYVRERVLAGTALRGADLADRVVLFVHGAGTPAEVSLRRAVSGLQLDGATSHAPASTSSRWT